MNNSIIKSWNNKQIRFREDGYGCLTDMAEATGKRVNNFLRSKSTKEYLTALSIVTQIRVNHNSITQTELVKPALSKLREFAQSDNHADSSALVEVIQGSVEEEGTWAHRRVCIRFAQWCSPEFSVQVDTWTEELLLNGKVSIASQPERIHICNLDERTMHLLNSWQFWREFPTRKEAYAYFYDPYSPQIGICPPYEAATLDDRLKSMSDFVFEYVIAFDSIRDPRSNAEGRQRCLKWLTPDRVKAAKDFQHQLDNPQLLLAGKAIKYPDLASRQRSLVLAAASN